MGRLGPPGRSRLRSRRDRALHAAIRAGLPECGLGVDRCVRGRHAAALLACPCRARAATPRAQSRGSRLRHRCRGRVRLRLLLRVRQPDAFRPRGGRRRGRASLRARRRRRAATAAHPQLLACRGVARALLQPAGPGLPVGPGDVPAGVAALDGSDRRLARAAAGLRGAARRRACSGGGAATRCAR